MNEIIRFEDVQSVAQTFALSGYFDSKGSSPAEVAKTITKILAGREMGFGPFASVAGIHIIQGKPTMSAGLMATAVKRSGKYDYRVRETTNAVCRIEFFERTAKGLESLGISVFSAEDAKAAGTQNMQKFPSDMLFARCMSRGVRRFCPDVFDSGTVYTPEEMGAIVDADGEIIETQAHPAPATVDTPAPTPKPATDHKTRVARIRERGEALFGTGWPAVAKEYAAERGFVWGKTTADDLDWVEEQLTAAEESEAEETEKAETGDVHF